MLETFKHLGPLLKLDRYERPSSKIPKRKSSRPWDSSCVDAQQDSWICFMQTEPQALLPSLIQKAAEWRQEEMMKEEQALDTSYMPLRCYLTQHLGETFPARLHRLAQSSETDPLKVAAIKHGMLTIPKVALTDTGAENHSSGSDYPSTHDQVWGAAPGPPQRSEHHYQVPHCGHKRRIQSSHGCGKYR